MSAQEKTPARRLVRPTLGTKFHIDYEWWDRADRDLDVYLRSHLCSEHQEKYSDLDADAHAHISRIAGLFIWTVTRPVMRPTLPVD